MDYLSICATVKDENSYLPEWIEYHKLVGVERFHLYDNGSKVPISKTLAMDVVRGSVIVTPFLGHAAQCEIYRDCLAKQRKSTLWLAIIDVDEFLCPKYTDDMRVLLRKNERFSGIGVNWLTFGPSGYEKRPAGLQIENFLLRGPGSFGWNRHIKTIAQPAKVATMTCSHCCTYSSGYCASLRGTRIDGPYNPERGYDQAQLNHYFTRSRQEFEEKMRRGSPDGKPKTMEYFKRVERACGSVRDEKILRFAPALRAALARRGPG